MKYLFFNSPNSICSSNCPSYLSEEVKKFWNSKKLCEVTNSIVAVHNGNIVGFFRFCLDFESNDVYACGTYVLKDFRNQAIATELWRKTIKKLKPKNVFVDTTSIDGKMFVCK